MKSALRKLSIGAGRGMGLGLALLLALVVLVPSICLVWFMAQAMRNEQLAVRQKLMDAYRANLALAQVRLESHWKETSTELDMEGAAKTPAAALFAREVRAGRADALICVDPGGKVLYPSAGDVSDSRYAFTVEWQQAQALETVDPAAAANLYARISITETNGEPVARALQAGARCFLRAGQKQQAISALTNLVAGERFQDATDGQGRLLVPNAELTLLELSAELPDAISSRAYQQLTASLGDYQRSSMPSSQRRFLMRQLQELFPGKAQFPTLAGEDLAAAYLETASAQTSTAGLRPSGLPGVWQFASPSGRVISLHKTDGLIKRMRLAADGPAISPDVRLNVYPPGQEAEGALLSQPVGADFPGWRLGLSLVDQQLFQIASRQRVSSYLWIGGLVIVAMLVLGSLALGLVRRQMALTQLRNDLVANVTHELKTPLTSMRLLVETLIDSPSLEEKTVREYLQLIARENSRLSRLIDNFLTFSRMERNKYAFGFKQVPARQIVDGASAALRDRLAAPHCHFSIQAPANLPSVLADADAMVTVLVNLLDNALKYSREEKEIILKADAENGHVLFSVKDNGIGLAPRDTRRIFKRFYQVNRAADPVGGCGLGLSIVQFVVTAHHGTVRVHSQPGKGSEFIVGIPAANPKAPGAEGGQS